MKSTKGILKSIALSVICFAMILSILSPAAVAKADGVVVEIAYKRNLTLSVSPSVYRIYTIRFSDKDLDGRIVTDVKADRNCTVDFYNEGFSYEGSNDDQDTGKITFTITLSGSGKKTVKKKCTINFIKYVNPLQKTSFIDSDVINQFKQGGNAYIEKTKKQKETVRYKAKKGWTIVSIRYEYVYYPDEYDMYRYETKSVKVKNNAAFTYPEDNYYGGTFVVKVKNKKSGFIETMYLDVSFPYTDKIDEY